MSKEFYTVLLYSLALTVGAFLIFFGYRYMIRTISGGKNARRYIKVLRTGEGDLSGEAFFRFELPESTALRLTLLDLNEKELKVLFEGNGAAGELNVKWSTGDFPDGEYYFLLTAPNQQIQRKLRIRNQA